MAITKLDIIVNYATTVVILLVLAVPYFILNSTSVPVLKSFFDPADPSIANPFHESTIPTAAFSPVVTILTILFIVLMHEPWNTKTPETMMGILHDLTVAGMGAVCTMLFTAMGKKVIGKPRPNFLDVCKPDYEALGYSECIGKIFCPSASRVAGEKFPSICLNKDNLTARQLEDIWMSWPSGHSSYSMYTMLFCALYLQIRWKWFTMKCGQVTIHSMLIKFSIQFLCLIFGIFTCISRIIDNKHHPIDVLSGAILGIVVAFWMIYYIKTDSHFIFWSLIRQRRGGEDNSSPSLVVATEGHLMRESAVVNPGGGPAPVTAYQGIRTGAREDLV